MKSKKTIKASSYAEFLNLVGHSENDIIALLSSHDCPPGQRGSRRKCERESCFACWKQYIDNSID
jgi:hypothetical protein